MSISTDVKVQWVEGATLVGANDTVCLPRPPQAAFPDLILRRTDFPNGSSRQLIIDTLYPSTSADARIIVTGTGSDDKPLVEEVPPVIVPATGNITFSKSYFKTISNIHVNTAFFIGGINIVSIGITDNIVVKVAGGNSIRLKGYSTAAPIRNTNNFLEFHNGDFLPETLKFEVYIPPLNINYPITDRGLVFKNGLYLKYVVGSLTMMNVFYA